MIFGGYYGNNYDNLSHYWEYEHARDLLSIGHNASQQRCEVAISFSRLKNDTKKLSLHILEVPKAFIVNKRFYK